MSNKKRRNRDKLSSEASGLGLLSSTNHQQKVDSSVDEIIKPKQMGQTGWLIYLKSHWWIIPVIVFLSIGALGAGLKYLDEDAKREIARRESNKGKINNAEEPSMLSRINPFVPAALPSPTPQLSKEYIYAGDKLLAVEDANANAAPPADLAIWRPSSGTWYVVGQTGSQPTTQTWGISGDTPVPGDYDGDGKTDFSIFRPSTNTWWILKSSNGTYYSVTFGVTNDKVAQADYDGDGQTDLAVFRPSNGTWYITQSSNSQTLQQQFGLSTDTPAPADFDGDGRADIAVWRDSNTTFYSINSSNGVLATNSLGLSGDKPVSSDYDGDGRADYALFRDSTATWYIRQSSNSSIQQIQWGISGDKLVQNDYDGDGKVDLAVWRNSNGNWYIRKSGSGGALRQEAWGTSGDIPVPAFYRR
jgi:hypothetical protein